MRETRLKIPVLALIAATRGMMGVGIGLLLSSRVAKKRRIPVGATLFGIGALSTIPLALSVFRNRSIDSALRQRMLDQKYVRWVNLARQGLGEKPLTR